MNASTGSPAVCLGLMAVLAVGALHVGCVPTQRDEHEEIKAAMVEHFGSSNSKSDRDYHELLLQHPSADLLKAYVASVNSHSLEDNSGSVFAWWLGTLQAEDQLHLVDKDSKIVATVPFQDVSEARGVRQGVINDRRIFHYVGLIEVDLGPEQRGAVRSDTLHFSFSRSKVIMSP